MMDMFVTTTTVNAGPYRLREMTYAPGARQGGHAHDEFQISFLMRGRMEETTTHGTRVAVAGQVIIKVPGTVHSNTFGPEGVRILCVDGDPRADPYLREVLQSLVYFPEHGGPPAMAALDLLRAFRQGQPLEDAVAELLASLPAHIAPVGDDRLARRAAAVVRERFSTAISLVDVAREVGTHRTHLARQFRRTFGESVGDYLRGCRVQHAAHLIASTSLPLVDIALQSGFADQSHLTRTLQRALGESPRRFRMLTSG